MHEQSRFCSYEVVLQSFRLEVGNSKYKQQKNAKAKQVDCSVHQDEINKLPGRRLATSKPHTLHKHVPRLVQFYYLVKLTSSTSSIVSIIYL